MDVFINWSLITDYMLGIIIKKKNEANIWLIGLFNDLSETLKHTNSVGNCFLTSLLL